MLSQNQSEKLTPLMRQYWEVKSQHPDKIVLFRMGDFFEMFFDDAKVAAPLLGIALTQRNKKSADETPMCGVPHFSISDQITKLLAAGHRVAICDQLEDAKLAKGLVKRGVTQILTPGMVYDPETLDQLSANYMACVTEGSIAFCDPSTGEAFYYDLALEKQKPLLTFLQPKEVIASSQKIFETLDLGLEWHSRSQIFASEVSEPSAQARLAAYILTLNPNLKTFWTWEARSLHRRLQLSNRTFEHLEILETYSGEKKGSLFYAVDRSKTFAGARLLKTYLRFPLLEPLEIKERQDQIQFWMSNPAKLGQIRKDLSEMGDIERRLARFQSSTFHPRDLLQLSASLRVGLRVSREAEENSPHLKAAQECIERIDRAIREELPAQIKNGGYIQKGYDAGLDQWISLSENSQEMLAQMEARERERTGIGSLKIRYNNIFGYYIEVTNTHKDKVPGDYQRRQTLAGAERYITPELLELEQKVLAAQSKRIELESHFLKLLKDFVLERAPDLLMLSRRWAEIDVFAGLAFVALENNYVRPQFADGYLKLESSRHPTIEQITQKLFVPNSVHMKNGEVILLSGPNMAGKSTLMRQMALISILAQIGSYVPAAVAELPILDQIFTRIGASDSLAQGLSTFMVEMQETSDILKSWTERSLIVLDEIGRGTGTYDGMSLAQAILEYVAEKKKGFTFFATHYHELTHLERVMPQIRNAHMKVTEKNGVIDFVYQLAPGPAGKSYGLHVAKLAGLPAPLLARAKNILKGLESFQAAPESSGQMTLSLQEEPVETREPIVDQLREEIKAAPISTMTPLEALNTLSKWQRDLS